MEPWRESRRPDYDIDPQFLERWSPRAFSERPVSEAILYQLFEAARWSPSCYNEQPWRFVYARTEEYLPAFRELLVDSNREWADRAPVLIFLFAKRTFSHNNKRNRWALFDAGAAWLSLALQAWKLGLFTHAMAGIHRDRVYEHFRIDSDEYTVISAIAVGYYGDPVTLSPKQRRTERPNSRNPVDTYISEGRFHFDS